MRVSSIFLPTCVIGALALSDGNATPSPSVKLTYGTIVGKTTDNIENFKGIPYAQPPLGDLRLRRPRPIDKTFGTITSTATPTACPQQKEKIDISRVPPKFISLLGSNKVVAEIFSGIGTTVKPQGENCLTLNVQRPVGITSASKLPVLFYIHGGAFEDGDAQMFDGSAILNHSIALGSPIIFVAVQYRLSAFGFLAGKELQKDGSTNLGLRDQRLGMQWVHDNIAAFGGDPYRVTIWGESAGAWSTFDHMIINRGDNGYKGGKLFHAAIMNSGMAYPATSVSSDSAQETFNRVSDVAGCLNKTDKLACLRSVSYGDFLKASNHQHSAASYSSLNLPFLPRPDSQDMFFSDNHYESLARHEYVKVPIISGNQEDEGTVFSLMQSNTTTTDQVVTYMKLWFKTVSPKTVKDLVDTYPDHPAPGAPFHTGKKNELYPQYKRFSAIIGDYCFTLARRIALSEMSSHLPATWSYLATYFHGTPAVGTAHGTGNLLFFNNFGPHEPRKSLMTYYISFINHLDPNMLSNNSGPSFWPKYTAKNLKMLDIGAQSNSIIKDDFRQESYRYLQKHRFCLKL